MCELTKRNIEFISKKVRNSNIGSKEMQEDIIDHLCCAIEKDMKLGLSFEHAFNEAYENIFSDSFDEFQSVILNSKTHQVSKSIKRFLYITAYFSLISLITTFYFIETDKVGQNIAILASSIIISTLFLPVFFIYRYKLELSKNILTKAAYALGFIGSSLFFASVIFKICHFPGAMIGLMFALILVCVSYIPYSLLKLYNKPIS